jgi:probable phosphomutase (TIGR03848 family)
MAIVIFIRHGENQYVKKNRLAGRLPGVHLNKKGLKQAKSIAKKLAGLSVKAIYSSPLERCMETASPIASALGLEPILRPGLIEVDFGEWEDKKLKKLRKKKLWRLVQGTPSRARFPGGESFFEAQHRICREIDSLVALHEPMDLIVCVSHSDMIKLAVAYYIGLPIDMFQRLHIAPASVTALYLGEQGSGLLTLNYEFSFTLPKN